MKFIIRAVPIIFLIACSNEIKQVPIPEPTNQLQGKVKSVKMLVYSVNEVKGEFVKVDTCKDLIKECFCSYWFNPKTHYELYNEDGKAIGGLKYDSFNLNKPIDSIRIYEVKNKNNGFRPQKEEVKFHDASGTLVFVEKFEYDNDGNLTVETLLNAHKSISHVIYSSYDERGNLIKHADYVGCKESKYLSDSTINKYDQWNNLIKTSFHIVDSDKQPYSRRTFEHQFDERNNWIRMVYRLNDSAKYMAEREIIYY